MGEPKSKLVKDMAEAVIREHYRGDEPALLGDRGECVIECAIGYLLTVLVMVKPLRLRFAEYIGLIDRNEGREQCEQQQ